MVSAGYSSAVLIDTIRSVMLSANMGYIPIGHGSKRKKLVI